MMKVLWLANVPAPYRVDFFNQLGRKCELTVLFERKTSSERDQSWSNYKIDYFKGIFLKGIKRGVDNAICPGVIRYLRGGQYDHIVVTNYSDITGIIAICYMKAKKISYWIEGDGAFAGSGRGVKEKIKKFLLTGAKGYFSSGAEHDKYYLKYGAKSENIFRYHFTSISERDILQAQRIRKEDKNQLREMLGVSEDKVVISVGRFSYEQGYGKGFDILMQLAERLGKEYVFFIVGDEPTEEFLQWKEKKGLNNVRFVGNMGKDNLAKYYAMADCFVLLSRGEAWGLVVNEAMSFGLPVIVSDRCISGIELVKEGVNGHVVSLNDIDSIEKKLRVLFNDDRVIRFGEESIKLIENYTIENMTDVHISTFTVLGGVIARRIIIRDLAKRRLGLGNNDMIVLYVGQVIERKGIDVLLKAAKQIIEKYRFLKFIIVGGEITEEYKFLSRDLREGSVVFVPFIEKNELSEYFRAADLFVLPTREDIWGLVINEAMMYELPIVTTSRCGAGLELVEENINGHIVSADDSEKLVEAIGNVFESECGRDEGFWSGTKIRNYTIENMVNDHICIFDDKG